jgi:hypothetical protein
MNTPAAHASNAAGLRTFEDAYIHDALSRDVNRVQKGVAVALQEVPRMPRCPRRSLGLWNCVSVVRG